MYWPYHYNRSRSCELSVDCRVLFALCQHCLAHCNNRKHYMDSINIRCSYPRHHTSLPGDTGDKTMMAQGWLKPRTLCPGLDIKLSDHYGAFRNFVSCSTMTHIYAIQDQRRHSSYLLHNIRNGIIPYICARLSYPQYSIPILIGHRWQWTIKLHHCESEAGTGPGHDGMSSDVTQA